MENIVHAFSLDKNDPDAMPLHIALQQPDQDNFVDALDRELKQHTELKHSKTVHKSQFSIQQIQSLWFGHCDINRTLQEKSSMESLPMCRRALASIWRHLLDHLCSCDILDHCLMHFYTGTTTGMTYVIY